jgi:hypothetical protein
VQQSKSSNPPGTSVPSGRFLIRKKLARIFGAHSSQPWRTRLARLSFITVTDRLPFNGAAHGKFAWINWWRYNAGFLSLTHLSAFAALLRSASLFATPERRKIDLFDAR